MAANPFISFPPHISSPKQPAFPPWLSKNKLFTITKKHSCHRRAVKKSEEVQVARDDLMDLISEEERGIKTLKNPAKRDKIIKAIEVLTVHGKDTITTSHEALSAHWRMLWTTEKEQLFIVQNAHLFGTQAGEIFQIINVAERSLQNVITFPPHGSFVVSSQIQVVSPQRVDFRFTKAILHGNGWKLPVPPFGKGWFESIYLDERLRVAKDIRGDYLVVDRSHYANESS